MPAFPLCIDFKGACVKPWVSAAFLKQMKHEPAPDFYTHQPDFHEIEQKCRPYQKYKNVLVIANGGSRTSALATIGALTSHTGKKCVAYCSTMDPAYIELLKRSFKPSDTLIMPISKSGSNVDVLEPLSAFWSRYPVLPVTGEKGSVLKDIAEAKGWDWIVHPEVSGRFSGRTASAYAPAHLAGVDVKEIDRGARSAYRAYHYDVSFEKNDAMKAAAVCFDLEQKGYTELFAPVYSWAYVHFLPLMTQLVHESFGKDGQGQTFYGGLAPESQHHTNQRFFGGRKNVAGMFVVEEASFVRTTPMIGVPPRMRRLPLRAGVLGDLDGVPFGKGLQFDFEGTREEALEKKIPHLVLAMKDASAFSVGWFLTFLHEFTVYSALLRGVDPFDQPEVEAAKERSFKKLKAFPRGSGA